MTTRTTTLKELEKEYTGTYSVKCDNVRGRKEVSFYNLKVGDEVLIDNYFTLIIEDVEEEKEMEERILKTIKEMDDSEIATLWNEYCHKTNNYDDEILDSDRFEEMVENSGEGAIYWMNRLFFGHDEMDENRSANPNRNYFYFNGYGNIVSMDYLTNRYADYYFRGPIDIDNLIDYIIENNDSLYNDDIQEILDDIEEQ